MAKMFWPRNPGYVKAGCGELDFPCPLANVEVIGNQQKPIV